MTQERGFGSADPGRALMRDPRRGACSRRDWKMLTFGLRTASDILAGFGLPPPPPGRGRYYSICPQCSPTRSSTAHRKSMCLGITIDAKGVKFGCNHCGWTGGALFETKANGHAGGASPFAAIYDYVDESGTLLFQVCRKHNKHEGFPQRRPDGKGGWVWNTKGIRKVLYRLPEVVEATSNERVILIVEGEKDVDAARKIGLVATCNPGGASKPGQAPKWLPEYSETLRGGYVVIISDHDDPGYAHADAIARMHGA
jgi:hypothetical protein